MSLVFISNFGVSTVVAIFTLIAFCCIVFSGGYKPKHLFLLGVCVLEILNQIIRIFIAW